MTLIQSEKERFEILQVVTEKSEQTQKEMKEKIKENKIKVEPIPSVEFGTTVKIMKKGTLVKFKPLASLHKKYFSKFVRPPITEKVQMYHLLKYPEWYLIKMLESDGKRKKRKAVMEELIVKVFTKYDSKKPSKVKPKTALQKVKDETAKYKLELRKEKEALIQKVAEPIENVTEEPTENEKE